MKQNNKHGQFRYFDNTGNYTTLNYIEDKENGLTRIFFASGNVRENMYEDYVLQTVVFYFPSFDRYEYEVLNGEANPEKIIKENKWKWDASNENRIVDNWIKNSLIARFLNHIY